MDYDLQLKRLHRLHDTGSDMVKGQKSQNSTYIYAHTVYIY